jgi:post-segregation antitoxin (ccd killing protein)
MYKSSSTSRIMQRYMAARDRAEQAEEWLRGKRKPRTSSPKHASRRWPSSGPRYWRAKTV